MKLFPALEQRYSQEHQTAGEAQRLAQEIAFAPVVFQVSRLMVKHGVFALLNDHPDGLTQDEIVEKQGWAHTPRRYCSKPRSLSARFTPATTAFSSAKRAGFCSKTK